MTAMNDSTAQLFAMFNDQLLQASDLNEGRFSEFSKIARKFGSQSDVILYRDATEEQRQGIDAVMQQCPNRSAYKAVTNGLHKEYLGTGTGAFDLLVLIYANIASVVGEEGEPLIYQTVLALPDECMNLRGEEMETMEAAIALTIHCVVESKYSQPWKKQYLRDSYADNSALHPQVHCGGGLLVSLCPEYPALIEAYPERAMAMVNAIKASPRQLDYSELELVVAGEQPVSLVEGML
jgi:hypothetical protein